MNPELFRDINEDMLQDFDLTEQMITVSVSDLRILLVQLAEDIASQDEGEDYEIQANYYISQLQKQTRCGGWSSEEAMLHSPPPCELINEADLWCQDHQCPYR